MNKLFQMKHLNLIWIFSTLIFFNCQNISDPANMEKWKSEVEQAEQDFNDLAQKEGLSVAFKTYAAHNGVIKRGEEILKGKQAIANYYQQNSNPNESLTWQPDFVDVSLSGDMAYTYGSYVFTTTDSTGIKKESRGKFHTVWKKQADGSWKFVWD